MSESILVVGAGIAGLGAGLALSRAGRKVTILERDPPPPASSPDEAFDTWERKGVGHLRHSHGFLAVLNCLLRDHYPDLRQQLLEAGCRELKFADGLPETVLASYKPLPEDDHLAVLSSRRTTFEFVMRRYVMADPNITLETDVLVRDLITETDQNGHLVVRGVMTGDRDAHVERAADLVIDAGGRNSQLVPWLIARGANIPESEDDAAILYYTRHYRFNPGFTYPVPGKIPGAGDLGYIKYGVFPADNGCFSITFAISELERELRKKIVDPDTFEALSRNIPGLARWIEPGMAEPRSRVLGMGDIKATWRRFVTDGEPAALNFFAIGDAAIRTNPLYGRGCSFGFLQAHILADVLAEIDEPIGRAIALEARVEQAVGGFYRDMVRQDKAAHTKARSILSQGERMPLRARMAERFVNDGVTPMLRSNANHLREAMRAFHMIDPPNAWIRKPDVMAKIARVLATPKPLKAHLYPPRLGPERRDMFECLGLSSDADLLTAN